MLDTNTVLSALVFPRGRMAALREAWQQARCHPLVSKATAEELVRVLAYPKFGLAPLQQQELLGDYLSYSTVIRIPARPSRTPDCRDPFDVPFLELALAGRADFLVSGDSDPLSIVKPFRCPIVSPDQFLKALQP